MEAAPRRPAPPPPRGGNADRGAAVRQMNTDACELRLFLEAHALPHYTETLLRHGYVLSNLDKLRAEDLRLLRITNRAEVESLVGLGAAVGEQKRRLLQRFEAEAAGGEAAGEAADSRDDDDERQRHRRVAPGHNVLTPTANECCRQAASFIAHRRVDRAWPMPASELTRSLGLSTARPHTGPARLFELLMAPKVYPHPPFHGKAVAAPPPRIAAGPEKGSGENDDDTGGRGRGGGAAMTTTTPRTQQQQRWAPVNQRCPAPPPPPSFTPRAVVGGVKRRKMVMRRAAHAHGASARSCRVCEDHVKACELHGGGGGSGSSSAAPGSGGGGQWQFRVPVTRLLGDGKLEPGVAWRAFDPVESAKLEYAFNKRHPGVVVSGKYADFATMQWGGAGPLLTRAHRAARKRSMSAYHPIRRSAAPPLNFPSLEEREVVPTPRDDGADDEARRLLERELAASFLRLCETEEQRARIGIIHAHTADTAYVLAEIRAMMDELFAWQRARLEDTEVATRRRIEEELLGVALDKLWDAAEQSVRKITYDVMTTEVRRHSDNVVLQQYDIVLEMEAMARARVEHQEAAERANLELLMAKLLQEYWRQQRRSANSDADRNNRRRKFELSNFADGCKVRCPICKSKDCAFFKRPWHTAWPQRGGVLDMDIDMRSHTLEMRELLHAARVSMDRAAAGRRRGGGGSGGAAALTSSRSSSPHRDTPRTLADLIAEANEKEYEELQDARRAERARRKYAGQDSGEGGPSLYDYNGRRIAAACSSPRSPATRDDSGGVAIAHKPTAEAAEDDEASRSPPQSQKPMAAYEPASFRGSREDTIGGGISGPADSPRRPRSAVVPGDSASATHQQQQRPPFKVGRAHTPPFH